MGSSNTTRCAWCGDTDGARPYRAVPSPQGDGMVELCSPCAVKWHALNVRRVCGPATGTPYRSTCQTEHDYTKAFMTVRGLAVALGYGGMSGHRTVDGMIEEADRIIEAVQAGQAVPVPVADSAPDVAPPPVVPVAAPVKGKARKAAPVASTPAPGADVPDKPKRKAKGKAAPKGGKRADAPADVPAPAPVAAPAPDKSPAQAVHTPRTGTMRTSAARTHSAAKVSPGARVTGDVLLTQGCAECGDRTNPLHKHMAGRHVGWVLVCAKCRIILLARELIAQCNRRDGQRTAWELAQAGPGMARTAISTSARRFKESCGLKWSLMRLDGDAYWRQMFQLVHQATRVVELADDHGMGKVIPKASRKAAQVDKQGREDGLDFIDYRDAARDAAVRVIVKAQKKRVKAQAS